MPGTGLAAGSAAAAAGTAAAAALAAGAPAGLTADMIAGIKESASCTCVRLPIVIIADARPMKPAMTSGDQSRAKRISSLARSRPLDFFGVRNGPGCPMALPGLRELDDLGLGHRDNHKGAARPSPRAGLGIGRQQPAGSNLSVNATGLEGELR